MAEIMCEECVEDMDMTCRFTKEEVPCDFAKCFAEAIYNAGYRKIDDNCEVITKDDLNLYKKQAVKEFAEKLKQFIVENACVSDDDINAIYHNIYELLK